jgi:hypothetical protein
MTRLLILGLVLAACGHKGKPPTTGEKIPPKRVVVGWGFTAAEGEMTDIFLALTDETGKQVSHQVGRYKGKCEKITPAKEMGALTAVGCKTGGNGTELDAVVQANNVVVMQASTTPDGKADPMAREEVTRVGFPLGAAVEAAP